MFYLICIAATLFISGVVSFFMANKTLKNIAFTSANFQVHAETERKVIHALVVNAVTSALKVTK